MKKHHPKLGICPHQEDYCDTCAKSKEAIRGRQTTINRLKAAATTEPCDIKRIEDEMTALKQSLERHRQESEGAHKYFMDVTKKCSKEWAEIVELEGRLPELTGDEEEKLAKLAVMKHKFNLRSTGS